MSDVDRIRAAPGASRRPGDYVALCAYFLRTPARDEALTRLRLACRDRTTNATTVGYGPRFLHSTGQLHKGGPNTGVFLQLTADAHGRPRRPRPGIQLRDAAERAVAGRPPGPAAARPARAARSPGRRPTAAAGLKALADAMASRRK